MVRMISKVLALTLLVGVAAEYPKAGDLQRAKTKKPRDAYRGDSQAAMSIGLNTHLRRAESNVKACDEWNAKELQVFMSNVVQKRSAELQDIYAAAQDNRRLTFGTAEEYHAYWDDMNNVVANFTHLRAPQLESHCREAVMMWTHHLTEDSRKQLRAGKTTVPLLPEGEKTTCGAGAHPDEHRVCVGLEKANSCDWCHSTQAAHDAGVPGTSPMNALNFTDGPDDGNPHNWNRTRRCDQDQLPRCQLCEGIGGYVWADNNSAWIPTPCEVVATPDKVNMSTVAPPLYPKQFTVKRKDGNKGGYSDILIGWQVQNSCFSFFPQNDSIGPLCYRSEESVAKYYDIEREAARTDYTLRLGELPPSVPNTTSTILEVGKQMWIVNNIAQEGNFQCVCTNPSGQHCTNHKPCYSYVWHWDTFSTAQYLGREKIGVEWIQDHGVANASKPMELDHFILWSHHIWTDPVSRRLVRAWKPFNGLQVYDPDAWTDSVEDPSVFDSPPAICKKPPAGKQVWRINCDDDGNYNGTFKTEEEFAFEYQRQQRELVDLALAKYSRELVV